MPYARLDQSWISRTCVFRLMSQFKKNESFVRPIKMIQQTPTALSAIIWYVSSEHILDTDTSSSLDTSESIEARVRDQENTASL